MASETDWREAARGPETMTTCALPAPEVTLASIARDLAPFMAERERLRNLLIERLTAGPSGAMRFGFTSTPLRKEDRVARILFADEHHGFDPDETPPPSIVSHYTLANGGILVSRKDMAITEARARRIARAETRRAYEGPPPTSEALRWWARETIPGRAWRRWSTARLRRMWRASRRASMAAEFRTYGRHDDTVDVLGFAWRQVWRSVGARIAADRTLRPTLVVLDDPEPETPPDREKVLARADDAP